MDGLSSAECEIKHYLLRTPMLLSFETLTYLNKIKMFSLACFHTVACTIAVFNVNLISSQIFRVLSESIVNDLSANSSKKM